MLQLCIAPNQPYSAPIHTRSQHPLEEVTEALLHSTGSSGGGVLDALSAQHARSDEEKAADAFSLQQGAKVWRIMTKFVKGGGTGVKQSTPLTKFR